MQGIGREETWGGHEGGGEKFGGTRRTELGSQKKGSGVVPGAPEKKKRGKNKRETTATHTGEKRRMKIKRKYYPYS